MTEIDTDYQDPKLLRQMVRFLGGDTLAEATAAYITASDPHYLQFDARDVEELPRCLRRSLDIGRSLWDRTSLVVDLDIDYVNFSFPAEAHVHPGRTFQVLQPVVDTARRILSDWELSPLHLLSGGGHHLIWALDQDSAAFDQLTRLAPLPETLKAKYRVKRTPPGRAVGLRLGRAYAGLALVMEYLAHRTVEDSAGDCPAPVEVTAVRVGPGRQGAEMVSVDISEYADPLHLRTVRVPFSRYLKPHQHRDMLGRHVVAQLSPLFLIPLGDMSVEQGLATMRSREDVEELAARAETRIPDASEAFEAAIDAYRQSNLADVHRWFYSKEPEGPERWPETYDAADLEALPACGRRPLVEPNDLLVKPDRIRHVVRLLLSRMWHPRDIAGLIRSKYERDYKWRGYWEYYDAASRAEAYTRLFAGLFFTGRDDLIDFNCRSSQEKGYCAGGECTSNLSPYRNALFHRRSSHV